MAVAVIRCPSLMKPHHFSAELSGVGNRQWFFLQLPLVHAHATNGQHRQACSPSGATIPDVVAVCVNRCCASTLVPFSKKLPTGDCSRLMKKRRTDRRWGALVPRLPCLVAPTQSERVSVLPMTAMVSISRHSFIQADGCQRLPRQSRTAFLCCSFANPIFWPSCSSSVFSDQFVFLSSSSIPEKQSAASVG